MGQIIMVIRHVILPKDLAKTLPKSRLLTETEWRGIGVQQSRGWQHYAIHRYVSFKIVWLVAQMDSHCSILPTFFVLSRPEPHILLFRRPLGTDPQSGAVVPELLAAAREEYKHQFGLRK